MQKIEKQNQQSSNETTCQRVKKKNQKYAISVVICGLSTMLLGRILVGLIMVIVGIVVGIMAINLQEEKNKAFVGFTSSIIGIMSLIIVTTVIVSYVSSSNSEAIVNKCIETHKCDESIHKLKKEGVTEETKIKTDECQKKVKADDKTKSTRDEKENDGHRIYLIDFC